MSYCTLEEAWGNNFTNINKQKKGKKYKKIYNKNGESIYSQTLAPKQKDNRHRFSFSRGNNRLENHNGPKQRVKLKEINLPAPNDEEDFFYTGKNSFGRDMTNSDYDNLEDDELPSFNDNKNDIIYDDISDEDDENDNYEDNNDQIEKNIEEENDLYKNNHLFEKINKLIEKIDMLVINNDNTQQNDYNDLFLFIFSGIILIFVLDTFVKFGAKFK